MKKLLTLFLALTMVFSLCACGTSGEGEGEGGLNVGFARENITPDFSVGLGGYSDSATRKSSGFLDYIYTTCIAVTEGEETILMITFDNVSAGQDIIEKIREVVTEATGISGEKIFVAATHCHSCPDMNSNEADATKYKEFFLEAVGKTATNAMADRAPATILAGTSVFEGMNFVRHYLLENGTYAGPSFGDFNSSPIKDHATETDPQMVLVKFDRGDDKQDVLMVNWQAHPTNATSDIGYNNISADFPGALRTKLEKDTGLLCAYFTGASGNQVSDSKIESEAHGLTYKEYGEKLAELIQGKLDTLQPVEGTGIKTMRVNFAAEIDHSWDSMLTQANEVYDLWKSTDRDTGNVLAYTYGFTSVYQARSIRTRADMPETQDLELNVFSIGGIAFTTGTYEMFSDAGLYVKRNSPFDITFLVTGNRTYIASEAAFDYRSYESDTGYYAKGTAEKLAEKYVEMLNGLK